MGNASQPIVAEFCIAERVARACIPDLRDVPLYIMRPQNGSPVTPEMMGGIGGLFRRGLDLSLRPLLESAGRWHGRGVAIIVDVVLCYARATNDSDGLRNIIGAVLHELGHWLDMPTATDRPDADYSYATFAAACEGLGSEPVASAAFPPNFLAHEESFCRLAAHLWYRASHGGGICLQPHYLRFGSDYHGLEMLPSPVAIIDVLWDELELFDGLALRRVAALPQPAAYTALWNNCLAKMF